VHMITDFAVSPVVEGTEARCPMQGQIGSPKIAQFMGNLLNMSWLNYLVFICSSANVQD
jgi:hypothetical protein